MNAFSLVHVDTNITVVYYKLADKELMAVVMEDMTAVVDRNNPEGNKTEEIVSKAIGYVPGAVAFNCPYFIVNLDADNTRMGTPQFKVPVTMLPERPFTPSCLCPFITTVWLDALRIPYIVNNGDQGLTALEEELYRIMSPSMNDVAIVDTPHNHIREIVDAMLAEHKSDKWVWPQDLVAQQEANAQ